MDFHRATLDLGRNKLRKRDRVIYFVVDFVWNSIYHDA